MVIREAFRVATVPAIIASLCCLSPVLLFSAGIVSLSAATELADVLYGEYRWVFRGAGLVMLAVFLLSYFRKKKVCSLDEVKRRRNEVINTIIIAVVVAVLLYIVFLYGVVELLGIALSIW